VSIVVGILKSCDRRLVHSDTPRQFLLGKAGSCPGFKDLRSYVCTEAFSFYGSGQKGNRGQLATNDFS